MKKNIESIYRNLLRSPAAMFVMLIYSLIGMFFSFGHIAVAKSPEVTVAETFDIAISGVLTLMIAHVFIKGLIQAIKE